MDRLGSAAARRSGAFRFLFSLAGALAMVGPATAGLDFSEPALFGGAPNGAMSQSGLTVGADGAFYGTAEFGGQHQKGTVFRYMPGGDEGIQAVHHFEGHDGARPRAALLLARDGSLWGVTGMGGAHSRGTIFRVAPSGEFETVHSFDDAGDYPLTALTQARDGWLYGATSSRTDNYCGTVYRIHPQSRRHELLHRFEGTSQSAPLGCAPVGRLLQARDGRLYGTAYEGGVDGQGTIYRVEPATGLVSLVHTFRGGQGANPFAGLTEGPDGVLYGVASKGGQIESGTVFRVKLKGPRVQALHHFDWFNEASSPICDLTLASDGYLYGCTHDLGDGSAFRIRPDGSDYNRFLQAGFRTPTKGADPWGRMIEHDGALWGTLAGGADWKYRAGSIYRLATTQPGR